MSEEVERERACVVRGTTEAINLVLIHRSRESVKLNYGAIHTSSSDQWQTS